MEKAKSIIFEDEIQRFIDLGLGRGVDSTKPSPWLNKSSFLVRTATFNNVIGTDEGGFLQTYKSSVSSTSDIQAQLKASVAVPNTPVSLGLEGEMSRSTNSSKKVVGKKVVNRTISFRTEQEDPLASEISTPDKDEALVAAAKEVQSRDYLLQPSFEETLSRWILKRINNRAGKKTDEKVPTKKQAIEVLSNYLLSASPEETALIVDDCAEFIADFGVTHYVSSITLGASEHAVMTESEYSRMVKEGVNVSVASVGSVQQSLTMKSKMSKSSSASQKIGKIGDSDIVGRGSNNEAVIGIKILPIHSLVQKNRFLHLSMYKALMEYSEERAIKPTGPYLIECGDDEMYWKIDSDYQLTVTTDMKQASVFHIIACEDTDDPYDFCIGWQGKTLQQVIEEDYVIETSKSTHSKIMRYLEVKTFFFGHCTGPLKLRSELSAKDSRLCLYKQLADDYFESPADITPWLDGNKVYFISSANRKSLLSIQRCRPAQQKEVSGDSEHQYIAKCVDSQKLHNEKNIWMLFRLHLADTYVDDSIKSVKTKKVSAIEKPKAKFDQELSKLLDSTKEQ